MPFEYRRIGTTFYRELADLVSAGQSAVLLSRRDLGKRFVLRKLSERLAQEKTALVVEIEFPHDPLIFEASAAQKAVDQAVWRAAPDCALESAPDGALLDGVKQLCDNQQRAVVMLASNVDSLAHHLAQLLLREVRVLVEKHNLTTVLTGEENLRDLVYGPESEFNCAHQFVLQAFERAEFLDYMRQRRETAQVPFVDEAACLERLFYHTDGNIHLARAALWAWLETHARSRAAVDEHLGPEELAEFLREFPVCEACGMDVFHSTTRVFARSPDAWDELESLKHKVEVIVLAGSAPRAIELAALAIRENGQLRFASDIMERFARRFYDDCRLGDLYAVHGAWERAFGLYRRMPAERRLRPGGAHDVPRLALVVRAFTASMHVVATRKVEENGEEKLKKLKEKLDALKGLFAQGCQLLLGVSDISFWTFSTVWSPQEGQHLEPALRNFAELILESADRRTIGWQGLSHSFSKRGALAVLPSVRPDWRDAVVVSDAGRPVKILLERQEFLREILEQFASAYDHCMANYGIQLRLKAREEHLRIATAIVTTLGETVRNPREALKAAAQGLLNLGYRRIMFALVDSKRSRIKGISEGLGESPTANVAAETDFALTDPEVDIQPWVVAKRKPQVVDDWRTWTRRRMVPRINVDLCKRAGTKPAFAVVPMFIPSRRPGHDAHKEEVFGTIHVERGDGLPPSIDDIEDLLEFGRQMAAIAHESERVGALLDALHCDQDSVVLFDADGVVRFANRTAEKRFGVQSGWHEAHGGLRLTGDPSLDEGIRQVITSSNPWARHDMSTLAGLGNREALLCVPLPDWRVEKRNGTDSRPVGEVPGPAIGAVLQARNLTGLHKVFSALQEIAQKATDRETTTQALLDCVTGFGYRSGRFYAVDAQDSDELVSVRASGLPRCFSEKFNQGLYKMRRQDPEAKETWWCLEENQPRIYQWKPSASPGSWEISWSGLTVFNVVEPLFRNSWKKTGDVWVDLPLLGSGRVIGKLTIDCGTDMRCNLQPEDFELLKLFSALLGALLDALNRKETWIREAADRAMATCAHNIRTKLAALDGFADRYRRAATGNAEVEELHRLHQPAVDGCFRQVTRIKETFADMQLQRAPTLIRNLVNATLEAYLSKERDTGKARWEITCEEEIIFNVDADRLRNALEEMLANSRAMVPPSANLKIDITASLQRRGSKDWLQLSVHDDGPGIPADKRTRVFESFYSERPYGGRSTGLGLNYVRRVITAHDGKVYVADEGPPGATFIIDIPESKI